MGYLPAWRLAVPAVAAHRGGSQEGPENTLYGMLKGLAAGATHLEIDVRGTADDIPVIFHDETTDRTCLEAGTISEMRAAEVRSLDPCKLWSGLAGIATGDRDPPSGTTKASFRVPTLEEVLEAFEGVPTILDLKATAPPRSVANVIKAANRTDDLILAGYDDDLLDDIAQRLPGVPRGAGREGAQAFFEGEEVEADAIFVPPEHEGYDLTETAWIERAHDQGKGFWVWTVNDVTTATELIEKGVDGIITDVPSRLNRLRLARLRGELG